MYPNQGQSRSLKRFDIKNATTTTPNHRNDDFLNTLGYQRGRLRSVRSGKDSRYTINWSTSRRQNWCGTKKQKQTYRLLNDRSSDKSPRNFYQNLSWNGSYPTLFKLLNVKKKQKIHEKDIFNDAVDNKDVPHLSPRNTISSLKLGKVPHLTTYMDLKQTIKQREQMREI